MELLTKEQCETGMEVQLIDPKLCYSPMNNNPTKGSIFECMGTIISVDLTRDYPMQVAWENGTTNCYKDKELSTMIDKCRSIW